MKQTPHEDAMTERLLRVIVEQTATVIGPDFFSTLVIQMATTLGVKYAFVGEIRQDEPDRIRSLAVCESGILIDQIEYDLKGTPCENVVGKTLCFYPENVVGLFPDNDLLVKMQATSYMGVPLFNSRGVPLGVLAVLHDDRFPHPETAKAIIRIFSARAGTELERQRISESVRESEERFRVAFEQAAVGIAHLTIEGRFLRVNQKLCQIVGYTLDEMLELSWYDMTLPEFVDEDKSRIDLILSGVRDDFAIERLYVRKGGVEVWVFLTVSLVRDDHGEPSYFVAVVEDITGRKIAEKTLAENEDRFRTLSEAAFEGIMFHENGLFLEANQTFYNMFGYQPHEMLGKYCFPMLIAPESLAIVTKKLAVETEDQYEIIGLRRDGTSFPAEINSRITSYRGKQVRVVAIRDLTVQKRAQESLRQTNEQLRCSIDSMPVGYIIWDTDFNVIDWNHAAERIFGYSRAEVLGKPALDFICTEDFRETFRYGAVRLFEGEAVVFSEKKSNVRSDDAVISCKWHNTPLKDQDGSIFAILSMAEDVTEQLLVEDQKQKYEWLVKNSSDFIAIATLDQNMLYVNDAGRSLVGLEPDDDVTKLTISDFLTEYGREISREIEIPTAEAHGHWSGENSLRHFTSGRAIPVHVDTFVINDARSGQPIAIGSVQRDITEAKKAEQEQYGRNRVLERLASGASLGDVLMTLVETAETVRPESLGSVMIFDKESRCLRHGAAPHLPKDFNSVIDGLAVGPSQCSCGTAAYMGERVIVEDVLDHPFWEEYKEHCERAGLRACWSEPIVSSNGEILGTFAMYFRNPRKPALDDIEFMKAMANLAGIAIERKQIEGALRRGEERYRTLVDTMSEGLVIVDQDARITYVNNRTCTMLERSREELYGRSLRDLVDEKNRDVLDKHMRNRRPYQQESYELEFRGGNGRIVTTLVSPRVVLNEDDKYEGFFAIITDITEFKRLEERVALSKKMESLGHLAGTVAHDLNNVLSGLVTYPDLLLLQIPEAHPMRRMLQTIRDSGERASAIVDDLLTLARRGVSTREVIKLNTVIENYFDSLEYRKLLTDHPGIEVRRDLDPFLLNVTGSMVHLSQTVMNLTSNAIEAMPDGGKLYVETSNQYLDRPIAGYDNIVKGDYVVLRISDTGTGISAEDIKCIFEPFYTKKIMGRSGTGLGLTVVWGTVSDYKGYIDVASTEGKGTTFRLFFPVTREPVDAEKDSSMIEESLGHGETILVVDDSASQREIACRMLDALGYVGQSVASGEEAVEYMREHQVNLILLDMILGDGMDGLDTFKRIVESNPEQKAIITSGYAETNRVREALRLGVGRYIKKPYVLHRIAQAIHDELHRRPVRR